MVKNAVIAFIYVKDNKNDVGETIHVYILRAHSMVPVPVANLLIIVNRTQKGNDNPSCIFPTPRWITFLALVGLTYRFAFSSDARREAAKWQSHGVSHMIWNWIDVVFIQFIRVCPRTNECRR